jgi:hypothetical protein
VDQRSVVTALVFLPKFYNPDAEGNRDPVEHVKYERTAIEITERFEEGGTLHDPGNPPVGFWWNKGFVDRDVLVILEHDFEDTIENRRWLETYARDVLLERFRQQAIYIKYVRVERAVVTDVVISKDRTT